MSALAPLQSEAKQAHYLRTIDDSPLGMFRLDVEGRIIDANRKLLDLLEYQWSELKGKGFNDITHPDDRWIGLEVLLDLRAGRADNAAYEKRFLTQSGRAIWAAVTASAITVDGQLTGVVVMVTDLSLRPTTDAVADNEHDLLKAMLSVAPIVVFACDTKGLLILCEGQGLGLPQSPAYLLGRPAWEVFEKPAVVREQLQKGLAGESGKFVMRFGGADFDCRYRPIQSLEGSVLGVTGVAQDVTALAKLTTENSRLSESMTTLSHELRNPLNVILGFTELLVNGTYGVVSDRQKAPLARIDLGGRQLLSLINDVLDLAKVKAGRIQLDDEDLEAGGVIHAALAEMNVMAVSKGVRLEEAPGPALHFKADARRVHQVLLNLLSNAIKFTPAGGVVSLSFDSDSGGGPRITVTDTGSGLTPDEIRFIFEEYGQLAAHRDINPHGSGLGLPISRKLAALMGGTLTAASTVGVGSKFCLALPRGRPVMGMSSEPLATLSEAEAGDRAMQAEQRRFAGRRLRESRAADAGHKPTARHSPSDVYVDQRWMSIRWDDTHKCIHAEFKAFANSSEFRTGMLTILDATWDRQAASLVSDNRKLEGVANQDQLWLRDTWVPLAVAAGVKRIAVVLGSRGLGKVASEEIIRLLGKTLFVTKTFDSLTSANDWVLAEKTA
jgi:PAS domain S-box-containing protein